ncbi:MAG: hypothetical protein NZ108_03600, partial [Bacteroidia bacterium]|nr:hypothetical protein [Bacteroidia bacterium]
PGMGNTTVGVWGAFSIRQDISPLVYSISYAGIGYQSKPNSFNPTEQFAIWILNQEIYHKFHQNWQSSFAVSYRGQNQYRAEKPFFAANPSFLREGRVYARLSYLTHHNRFHLAGTLRQEYRRFWNPNWSIPNRHSALRSRFRGQLSYALNQKETAKIISGCEVLFSHDFVSIPSSQPTQFRFTETRTAFYYSQTIKKLSTILNIGIMLQLVKEPQIKVRFYPSIDIQWRNPFPNRKKVKETPIVEEELAQ